MRNAIDNHIEGNEPMVEEIENQVNTENTNGAGLTEDEFALLAKIDDTPKERAAYKRYADTLKTQTVGTQWFFDAVGDAGYKDVRKLVLQACDVLGFSVVMTPNSGKTRLLYKVISTTELTRKQKTEKAAAEKAAAAAAAAATVTTE